MNRYCIFTLPTLPEGPIFTLFLLPDAYRRCLFLPLPIRISYIAFRTALLQRYALGAPRFQNAIFESHRFFHSVYTYYLDTALNYRKLSAKSACAADKIAISDFSPPKCKSKARYYISFCYVTRQKCISQINFISKIFPNSHLRWLSSKSKLQRLMKTFSLFFHSGYFCPTHVITSPNQ